MSVRLACNNMLLAKAANFLPMRRHVPRRQNQNSKIKVLYKVKKRTAAWSPSTADGSTVVVVLFFLVAKSSQHPKSKRVGRRGATGAWRWSPSRGLISRERLRAWLRAESVPTPYCVHVAGTQNTPYREANLHCITSGAYEHVYRTKTYFLRVVLQHPPLPVLPTC